MADGVEVVLDQWSLKHGQDVNSFMEQMVLEPTITRVLVISDAKYAEKANTRKGGVGTESQIISEEIYKRVDQEKFIPVVRERDPDRNPCLPVFLKSRLYLDFSDAAVEAESYDGLLRNIFDRPSRPKPPLGKPPAHLFDDSAISIPAAQKAKRFQDIVVSGKGSLSAAFEDFTEEFLANFACLRLAYSHDQKEWCDTFLANIATGMQYRDICVNAIRAGIGHIPDQWFIDAVLAFLERLLAFRSRSAAGSYSEVSEDNYTFLIYELFLYVFASCVKSRRYADAAQLLEHRYVASVSFPTADYRSCSYGEFGGHVKTLDDICNSVRKLNRISVTADQIVERATRSDITVADIIQADVLCALASVKRRAYWYPRIIIYGSRVGKLELFARAVNERGLAALKTILAINDAAELFSIVNSKTIQRMYESRAFFHADVELDRLLNLREIAGAWGVKTDEGRD
jgi:hypothetical protein